MSDETLLRSHGLRTNIGRLIRKDTLDGREYIVAPVVLITEGVHNNVLYTAAELSKHTDAWNGRPLVAPSHPTVNGRPVTANSKRVLEKMEIGKVLNVNWDAGNKKLRGEAWFDKEKTEAKCPKVLAELEKDAPQVEVSTGLFTDDTMKANVFGNKQYACEAKNHRPDHLAILIGGKGACSWEDGAGLPRINAAMDDDDLDEPVINAFEGGHISDEDDDDPETCPDCGGELVDGVCPECDGEAYVEEPEKKPAKQNSVMHVLSAIAEKLGIVINRKVDISAAEKANRVSNALSARYNPAVSGWGPSNTISTPSPWLRDLFDGYVVYEMYGKTFKLSLSWDNGQPVFEGEPVEVVQNTEWVPKNNSDDKWLETEGSWEVPGWEASHNNWDESQHPRGEDGKFTDGGGVTDIRPSGFGYSHNGVDHYESGKTSTQGAKEYVSEDGATAIWVKDGVRIPDKEEADRLSAKRAAGGGPNRERVIARGAPGVTDEQQLAGRTRKWEVSNLKGHWAQQKITESGPTLKGLSPRDQRHILYEERDQDGTMVRVVKDKTSPPVQVRARLAGTDQVMSVRDARHLLFDVEPHDSPSPYTFTKVKW